MTQQDAGWEQPNFGLKVNVLKKAPQETLADAGAGARLR
jgi:hypothetical protein